MTGGYPPSSRSRGAGTIGLISPTGPILLVDPDHPAAADDGSQATPFVTIQAALNVLGAPTSLDDQKVRYSIQLAPGRYDEDLTNAAIVGRRVTFYLLGPITLGDGAGPDFGSTVPRNITWDCSPRFGGRGVLAISTYNPSILYGARCTQAGAFDLSGNLVLTGNPTAAFAFACRLNMVRIRGNVDGTALTSLGVDMHCGSLRIDGNVTGTNIVIVNAHFTAFRGTVTIFMFVSCVSVQFEGAVVVSQVPTFAGLDTLPPGLYGCRFNGSGPPSWTGPANCLMLDAASNYWFKAGSWTLGGAASKVIMGDLTP